MTAKRKATYNRRDIKEHFKKFAYALEEFGILQDDCFNFDESGFRIGCLNGRIVIIHTNIKAIYLADPDIRESITAIECVSAGGWAIPSMLILAGSLFLQKHFENDLDENTLFGISNTGYSNSNLSME